MKEEQILALDLSTKNSGWCIGTKNEIIQYGCVSASSLNNIKRIIKMKNEIQQIIKDYNIQKIIIEEVRTDYKNAKTYKALTWLQGVIVIAATEINPKVEIEYLQPSSWRSTIGIMTGRGIKRDQLKQADIDYVNKKYNLQITSDDIADAICLKDAYFKRKDLENRLK